MDLGSQGWDISDASIQAGLEETQLPGRSQILTQEEALLLGLHGATVLIDGAHTEASAKTLSNMIETVRPEGPLALVVGMANDKAHFAFAEQLLAGSRPDVVLLTEASIAGGASRTMPALSLKEIWMAAARYLDFNCVDIGTISGAKAPEYITNLVASSSSFAGKPTVMIGCQDDTVPSSCDLIRAASQLILESGGSDDPSPGLICVTGSLHLVASVLQHLERH